MTNKEELQGKITEFSKILKKEDLSFTQINDIYSYYNENAAMMKDIDPEFSQRIEDYKKVSDALQNGKPEDIWKDVRDKKLKIEKIHNEKMFNYFVGSISGSPSMYSEQERNKRFAKLKKEYSSFESFVDLIYVADVDAPTPPTSNTQPPTTNTQPPVQRTSPVNPPVNNSDDDRD